METVKFRSERDRARFASLRYGASDHEAASGSEVAWDDLSTFLRVALCLLPDDQQAAFWADDAVSEIVRGTPEYRALSIEVYGESDCGAGPDGAGGGPG